MTESIQLTEADIRAAVERFGEVIPGVSNEKVADTAVAALNGELVMKDFHGLTDEAMEAIYGLAYNEFQACRFEEAHRLFVFLCMVDHLNETYWMALGACRFGSQDYAAAAGAYAIASMVTDNDPTPIFRAADCYLACGDMESAIDALKHGIELCGDKSAHREARERGISILELVATNTAKDG